MKIPDYLTEKETAAILRVRPATLADWRWKGVGPSYSKAEGRVLYSEMDIKNYLALSRGPR